MQCMEKIIADHLQLFKVDIINLMSDRIHNLELRISELESKKCDCVQQSVSINTAGPNNLDIVSEMNERASRKRNAILFNFPESNAEDHKMKSEYDMAAVTNVLRSRNVTVAPAKVLRLGRHHANNSPRPLKIIFHNDNDAITALRSNSGQTTNILKPDRTRSQMEYYKNIRQELEARKSNGESHIIIKYRNDVPYISEDRRIPRQKN